MTTLRQQRGPRLSIEELKHAAAEMRALDIVSIFAAGSGHPGGTLSVIDVAAALYLRVLNHDPHDPDWEERDRVFWSAGHKAPALYLALGKAGYFDIDATVLLRQLGSGFEGHPDRGKLPGVEVSSGSLGQGLGIAVGNALAARLLGRPNRVYCIMGDGEQQEGSIWEAVMAAGHYKLDNLCAIVDSNRLQIDGRVCDVMNIEPLAAKYRAFNWHVLEVDGHDVGKIVEALEAAAGIVGTPTVVIAQTVKGKGVSFMENVASWHGVAPDATQFEAALAELATPAVPRARVQRLLARAGERARAIAEETQGALPRYRRDYGWNAGSTMRVEMDPTRMGFGRGLERAGNDPRVVAIHADISGSIRISDLEARHPERQSRVFSVGIAEQNMMQVAAGLAREGLIPVTGTYGVFAAGRAWDQIRTTLCYSDLNVKIAGAHGGVSVGPDGATHQALEDIALMTALPNMRVVVPCDALETERATLHSILEVEGPCYLRFAREATPVVTGPETPYRFGLANVVRFRGEQPRFRDTFEHVLSADYRGEGEDASIVACGPMVPEAMRAAWLLYEELGLEIRVIDLHTLKPLDVRALVAAADDTGIVVTVEEHQIGGLANLVAASVLAERERADRPLLFDRIGVRDRFGRSGQPWELIAAFGLGAEHIAEAVHRLYLRKTAAAGRAAAHHLELEALECARCGRRIRFETAVADWPALDDACAGCGRRSVEACTECLSERILAEPGSGYVCAGCLEPASAS